MRNPIKALEYYCENTGKPFKMLSTQYTWNLKLDNIFHSVEYIVFKWKKKRKVYLDKHQIFEGPKSLKEFSYTFKQCNHILTITEFTKGIDLHIDGLSFLVLLNRQASSVLIPQEIEEHLAPVRWKHSSNMTNKAHKLEDWEKKAQNYRLIFRNIEENTLREQVLIYPRPKSLSPRHIDLKFINWEFSPRNTLLSTHFRSPLNQSNSSISNSKKFKNRKQRKFMNFFLMA